MDSGPAPSGASRNDTDFNFFQPSPNPSLRAQRSNPPSLRMCHGLLRFARNDDNSNPPPSSRTSEARCGTHNHRAWFARKSSNSIFQMSDTGYGSSARSDDTDFNAGDEHHAHGLRHLSDALDRQIRADRGHEEDRDVDGEADAPQDRAQRRPV